MSCTLVLIAGIWLSPCNVQGLVDPNYQYAERGETIEVPECRVYYQNTENPYELENITCADVARKLKTAEDTF